MCRKNSRPTCYRMVAWLDTHHDGPVSLMRMGIHAHVPTISIVAPCVSIWVHWHPRLKPNGTKSLGAMMLRMGSLFSGIGGLDLGLERAFKGQLQTAWQVEENQFCCSILERHWPHAKRYDDVRTVGAHNLEPVDILCGGFPCQDISIAGKGEGLNGKRSGLWWEFHRIINELRPSVVVMENVPAITIRGLSAVVGSLAQIGYDCQWTIISAKQCGAPHLRRRWFAVAYPTTIGYYMRNEMAFGTMPNNRWSTANTNQVRSRTSDTVQSRRSSTDVHDTEGSTAYPNSIGCRTSSYTQREHQHRIHREGDTTQGIQQRSEWQSGIGEDSNASTNTISTRTQVQAKGNSQASKCLEARARRTGKDFQLNPQFVEEMMGFPIGWTDLNHSETQSSHSALNGSDNK